MEIKSDIIFATSIISCYSNNLFQQYIKIIKTIMHYLKAIKTKRIIASDSEDNSNLIIKNYFDFN